MPLDGLLRGAVDPLERRVRRLPPLGEHLGDRRGQRGLAVVDVAHRADVEVRLVAHIGLLGHDPFLLTPGRVVTRDGAATSPRRVTLRTYGKRSALQAVAGMPERARDGGRRQLSVPDHEDHSDGLSNGRQRIIPSGRADGIWPCGQLSGPVRPADRSRRRGTGLTFAYAPPLAGRPLPHHRAVRPPAAARRQRRRLHADRLRKEPDENRTEIWLAAPGAEPRRLAEGSGARWSPDGRVLAYLQPVDGVSRRSTCCPWTAASPPC